ncbi:hypothetical protein EPO05_01730 [Patescibacteria group bacterium]|nr:MAG: hypothetical protein EPO05_01730 [Patescibacteria group bacterium]
MGVNKNNNKTLADIRAVSSVSSPWERGNTLFLRNLSQPVLVSRGRKSTEFFTEDSKLYVTPQEQALLDQGVPLDRSVKRWDNVSSRIVNRYQQYRPGKNDMLTNALLKRFHNLQAIAKEPGQWMGRLTLPQLWNASMVAAVLIGMVSMTFIYQYLGQGASAKTNESTPIHLAAIDSKTDSKNEVAFADKAFDDETYAYFSRTIKTLEETKKDEFEARIREMVKGYPIAEMVPYIVKQDKLVAAFLISIAKKESGWGEHVPVLNGRDCFNYWGYRGIRKLMGTGGHTCFDSREDAVETVAKRISFLVSSKKLNTPEKMIIWKCGSDCNATGGQAAARKWISDVDLYFKKLNK